MEDERLHLELIGLFSGLQGVYEIRSSEAAIIEALKDSAVFTLDTASALRWGARLVRTPNVSAHLPDVSRLGRLEADGVLVRDTTNTFIYASPFPVGPRLFVAVSSELPPHETLPSGHRVVTTDRLVREFIGTFGLRLDLLTLLDTCIEQNPRFGSDS